MKKLQTGSISANFAKPQKSFRHWHLNLPL